MSGDTGNTELPKPRPNLKPPNGVRWVANRKWKLTLWLVLLYTAMALALYHSLQALLADGMITESIWHELVGSTMALWTYGVLLIGGTYLGVNLVQKWSPPEAGGAP